MNDNMSPASLAIIEEILNELNLEYSMNDNPVRPSIHIVACDENLKRKIYFNIPKNVNFVFQLLFENGNSDVNLRDDFATHLRNLYGNPYSVGGKTFRGREYLTIYLPSKSYVKINPTTKERIKKIIKEEIEKVCKSLKSFEIS